VARGAYDAWASHNQAAAQSIASGTASRQLFSEPYDPAIRPPDYCTTRFGVVWVCLARGPGKSIFVEVQQESSGNWMAIGVLWAECDETSCFMTRDEG